MRIRLGVPNFHGEDVEHLDFNADRAKASGPIDMLGTKPCYNRQMKSDGNEHLGEVVHCGRMMIYLSDRILEF